MTPAPEQTPGLAVLCDRDGAIQEVVRNGFALGDRLAPGRSLTEVVDAASVEKARDLLAALREQQAAFNWELNVPLEGGRVVSLHFAGGAAEGGFLVIGAKSRAGVARFYEELIRINNEQTNALRAAMKDLSLRSRERADRDSELYDELSRLNNELATAQRELAKKNHELARLNGLKNQFLGIAAHDLRNPLEVILTYSQFLLDDAAPALAPEQVEFIHRIRSSSAFMLSLVNDLLDVAKIEAGKLSLDLAPVDLAALVERNVALNRALAEKRGVRLDLKLGEELPRPLVVALDAPKIEQVLNNLIGNAVKFSPPGAAVEVGLAHGGRALVTVRDAGPGISPEEREKLFRPFVTFAKPRTAGGDLEKGTGLGLAIVRKIVAGHGGDLWVESEEGKGATFYVALPTEAAGAVER